jgi:hypothetical protein
MDIHMGDSRPQIYGQSSHSGLQHSYNIIEKTKAKSFLSSESSGNGDAVDSNEAAFEFGG